MKRRAQSSVRAASWVLAPLLAACAALSAGCDSSVGPSTTRATASARASGDPRVQPASASADAVPSTSDSDSDAGTVDGGAAADPEPPRAPEPTDRCKAEPASRTPVHLGTHRSDLLSLAVHRGTLYAVGALGRYEETRPCVVYRIARDGSGTTDLSTADPKWCGSFHEDATGLYLRASNPGSSPPESRLLRLSREQGPTEAVFEHLPEGVLFDGYVYYVTSDDENVSVMRVPARGGEPALLRARPYRRLGWAHQQYQTTHVGVDADGVFVADAMVGKIVRLDHAGGTPTELLTGLLVAAVPFPRGSRLYLSTGWESPVKSISKRGGGTLHTGCSDMWARAVYGDVLYLFGRDEHYLPKLMVVVEGKLARKEPLKHIWMSRAAADERCLYYARVDPSGTSWFDAIARPEP